MQWNDFLEEKADRICPMLLTKQVHYPDTPRNRLTPQLQVSCQIAQSLLLWTVTNDIDVEFFIHTLPDFRDSFY